LGWETACSGRLFHSYQAEQYRLGARIFRNRRTTFFGGHRAQIEIAAEFRELHLFYRRTLGYTSNQSIFDFHYVTQPRAMFNA
jgi:hypothetical protein